MEQSQNFQLQNDLLKLKHTDDRMNSTLRALREFEAKAKLFGMEILGTYLQTPDGSATRLVSDYIDVIAADRGLNYYVDWAYPGEAVTVNEDGRRVSSEMSNLGQTLGFMRHSLRASNAFGALAGFYDEATDVRTVIANAVMSWPEMSVTLNKAIEASLREVFAAESKHDPTLR